MTVSIKRERYVICSSFCEIGKKKHCFSSLFILERLPAERKPAPHRDQREVGGAAALRQPSASVGSRDPRPVGTCQRTCTVVCREHARERCNRERHARNENGVVTERECCRFASRDFHEQQGKPAVGKRPSSICGGVVLPRGTNRPSSSAP